MAISKTYFFPDQVIRIAKQQQDWTLSNPDKAQILDATAEFYGESPVKAFWWQETDRVARAAAQRELVAVLQLMSNKREFEVLPTKLVVRSTKKGQRIPTGESTTAPIINYPVPQQVQLAAVAAPKPTQQPNKMAQADTRWGTKVAWLSKDLAVRQTDLETYSVEVAMLFEAVRTVTANAVGDDVAVTDLDFVANFGSPIKDNKQQISIKLFKPLALRFNLIRELIDGRLKWSAQVLFDTELPDGVVTRLAAAVARGGELPMRASVITRQDVADEEQIRKEKQRRKIKL